MRFSHTLVLSSLLLAMAGYATQAKTRLDAEDTKPEVQDDEPTTRPSATTLPAQQILDRMLQSRPDAGKALAPVDAPAVAESDKPFTRKEGDLLRQRSGRLVRAQDGNAWEFHFEADGKTLEDPPMGVLPNSKLAAMEATLKKSNRDVRFRITGVTTLYNGHNFILIDRAQVMPD